MVSSLTIASNCLLLALSRLLARSFAASTASSEKLSASFFSNPNKKKMAIPFDLAANVRVDPLFPWPGIAILFLQTPPPRSASKMPCSISLAAAHNSASVKIFFAHLANVFTLNTLLARFIPCYSTRCNSQIGTPY